MKVATLLLLAYLACFASAQSTAIVFNANAQATCATANGCAISSVITNLGQLVTALVSGSLTIDISQIGTGVNVNIDANLLTGITGTLNLAALAVGAKSTLTVVAGVTVQTANFTVAQGSTAFVNGVVTVQNSASATAVVAVDASSALWVSAQGSVTATTTVAVDGVANVQGTISSTTAYVQSNNQLILNSTTTSNGTVTAPSVSIAGSAFLSGNGVVGGATATASATVYVSGTVNVGNSPGTVTINGDWRPSGASFFTLEIASGTSFDKLYVTGKAYLNGGLRPTLLGGYVPNVGDRFTFIVAGSTDGSFSTTVGSPIAYTTKFSSSVTANTVIANFSGATTVVISALVMVACVLASML